jgi:hypothetical protein
MKGAIVSEWVVRCWRSTCSRNRQASGKKAAAIEAWQAEGWQLVDRPGHGRAWWCGQCQANASVDPPAAIAEDRERARARLDELGEQPEVVIGVDWAAPGSEDRGVSIVVTQAAEPSDGLGLDAARDLAQLSELQDRRCLVGKPGPELEQLDDLPPVEEIPRPGRLIGTRPGFGRVVRELRLQALEELPEGTGSPAELARWDAHADPRLSDDDRAAKLEEAAGLPNRLESVQVATGTRWRLLTLDGTEIGTTVIATTEAWIAPEEYADLLAARLGADPDVIRQLGGL